jgi:hypothetical protein
LPPGTVARNALHSHAVVLAAYAAVALLYSWPLPLHFSTHLTSSIAGDTGVYIWNQWVFQREILDHRQLPYFTDAIFSLSGDDANLSLHNYTTFQNLLALPFIRGLGVVTTFNVVMLLTRVLTAYSMFLLARRVTGRTAEAWVAGVAFAWSPVLVTRSMGHFSLMAAAPLAVFLLVLLAAAERGRWGWRDIAAFGLVIGWATLTDPYFGIYCLLLGGLFLAAHAVQVTRLSYERVGILRRLLNRAIVGVAALVIALILWGGWDFAIFDQPVSVHSLYTPVLLLTFLVGVRIALHYRFGLAAPWDGVWKSVRVVAGAGAVTAVLLSPLLYAFSYRVMRSGLDLAPAYWRNSPRGVDLLSLFLPNPNHPWAPEQWRLWLANPTPDAYLENVVSVPLAAVAVLILAWFAGWRPSRWWALVTCAFGLLALGPFVHVAGINTFVPGPWALLRFVPVIDMARTPARFSIVLTLGASVLFAAALCRLTARRPQQRRAIVVATAAILLVELLPAPRQLYSGKVPAIYSHVIASPLDTRVLHLPFGVRDGTASEGNFSAQTQYFQTAHGRRLIGGYLSRVSERRRLTVRSEPVLAALMALSENRSLPATSYDELRRDAPEFLRRANIGYVIIDRSRLPRELDTVAIDALRLTLVDVDTPFELYRPARGP